MILLLNYMKRIVSSFQNLLSWSNLIRKFNGPYLVFQRTALVKRYVHETVFPPK